MTLPKHMDKFRDVESQTEKMVDEIGWRCTKPVYLQREVLDNLDSETFRTLKRISIRDLKRNCLIDDEFIMAILDRICLLEKQIKELKK